MEFLGDIASAVLPVFNYGESLESFDTFTEEISRVKPCEGFGECLTEGLSNLALEGEVTMRTIMERIRGDFILSTVLLATQVTIFAFLLRRQISKGINRVCGIVHSALLHVGRVITAKELHKAADQIEALHNLNVNMSKIAQTRILVLEDKLKYVEKEKDDIKEDLTAFKTTVVNNQKEHLDLTKRWAKHVEEIMEKKAEKVTPKKTSGIPVLLKNTKHPATPKTVAGDQ